MRQRSQHETEIGNIRQKSATCDRDRQHATEIGNMRQESATCDRDRQHKTEIGNPRHKSVTGDTDLQYRSLWHKTEIYNMRQKFATCDRDLQHETQICNTRQRSATSDRNLNTGEETPNMRLRFATRNRDLQHWTDIYDGTEICNMIQIFAMGRKSATWDRYLQPPGALLWKTGPWTLGVPYTAWGSARDLQYKTDWLTSCFLTCQPCKWYQGDKIHTLNRENNNDNTNILNTGVEFNKAKFYNSWTIQKRMNYLM